MSDNFFKEMSGFSRFEELDDERHFVRAPSDWWIVITDVIGSTAAIEQGRYRDVNMVGAATLAALQNAMPGISFPFAFGGDGASAIIPPGGKEASERELAALRTMAKNNSRLGLRVGLVEVCEIEASAGPVWVGKHLLEDNYPLAVFRGGGLSAAEERIKSDLHRYQVPERSTGVTDLSNLTCNWKPLEATHGQILSILFSDPEGNLDVCAAFLRDVDELLEQGIKEANPVRTSAMQYKGLSAILSSSSLAQKKGLSAVSYALASLWRLLLFRLGLGKLFEGLRRYVERTREHTDFRKYDDMLRMVLDVSPSQADAIEALCRRYRSERGAIYGVHRSQRALMTCYVPSTSTGKHLHFVDGDDGGYAIAAKQLKAQLNAIDNTVAERDPESSLG